MTALDAFAAALGPDAVLRSEAELEEFRDPYAHSSDPGPPLAAAVLPSTVEEVQAVVRIANEHGVTLWTVSQGRNYAYGGASPATPGSVLVNLRRMSRVLEVDEECAYALVEPGVRFFDLYEHLRAGNHRLWASVPVLGWGSVVGNTLEGGWGYTPNGDHAANQCGMEVVLPNGDLLRTGMGAMSGNRAWQAYRRGFGPSPDGLFTQSNLGIVTKMGVWLMPEPECYLSGEVSASREAHLEPLVDTLRGLLLDRTIPNHPLLTTEDGSAWNLRFALYGPKPVVDAQLRVVRRAFGAIEGLELSARAYSGDRVGDAAHPIDGVQAGIPGLDALQVVKARGGEHGGLIDFSPVSPLTGRDAVRVRDLVRPLLEQRGFAYTPGTIVTPRSLLHICPLSFDTTDEARVRAAEELYPVLVREVARAGYGLYRAHVRFMDQVAGEFRFNDGALRRFQERIKDGLDPAGVLSPGKQGVWPAALRGGVGTEC